MHRVLECNQPVSQCVFQPLKPKNSCSQTCSNPQNFISIRVEIPKFPKTPRTPFWGNVIFFFQPENNFIGNNKVNTACNK